MPVHPDGSVGARLCHRETQMLPNFPAQGFIRLQSGFVRNATLSCLFLFYGKRSLMHRLVECDISSDPLSAERPSNA